MFGSLHLPLSVHTEKKLENIISNFFPPPVPFSKGKNVWKSFWLLDSELDNKHAHVNSSGKVSVFRLLMLGFVFRQKGYQRPGEFTHARQLMRLIVRSACPGSFKIKYPEDHARIVLDTCFVGRYWPCAH